MLHKVGAAIWKKSDLKVLIRTVEYPRYHVTAINNEVISDVWDNYIYRSIEQSVSDDMGNKFLGVWDTYLIQIFLNRLNCWFSRLNRLTFFRFWPFTTGRLCGMTLSFYWRSNVVLCKVCPNHFIFFNFVSMAMIIYLFILIHGKFSVCYLEFRVDNFLNLELLFALFGLFFYSSMQIADESFVIETCV